MTEEYNQAMHEIAVRAREDADRQARLMNIKESRTLTENRRKALSGMKKHELVDLINGAWPDLEEFKLEKLSWKNLPFIPEDLGFTEKELETEERGVVRVYYRDSLVITKLPEGKWRFKTTESLIEIKIKSKFVAYQILLAMGHTFDGSESTVPETDIPIKEIIEEEE